MKLKTNYTNVTLTGQDKRITVCP